MCSKNAETKINETANRADSAMRRFTGSLHPRSITRWLTLHYVVWTAALLCLAVGFLYWTLKHSLDHARHGMLASKSEVLRVLVRDPGKAAVLANEVEHEAAESLPFRYYARVMDDQGRVLLETPGMKELPPPALFPPPVEDAEPQLGIRRMVWAERTLLLLSVRAPVGAAGTETRTLQTVLDVSPGAALLADYRNKLLMVLGVGIMLAAVAGVWIARQGMRPLVEITKTAQHITASQLHERITGAKWPAELSYLAAAFDAMLDRLEESFTRLSQFSADLAHALRSPINNLRGEAEVALARSRTPEEYQEILASSLEEFERLSRMIDGLLFLARADDPKMAVQRVPFDARKQIEAVREFYEALASEQQVEVICEGNASLTGDPMLFRRVVSNLLANSLRHTSAHDRVVISLFLFDDQAAEVRVRDTGSGIAPEHLPKIFERFYQARQSSSSKVPGGTGLGLTIVQSIMRLHGGTVSVESALGQGTTVTLQFPASGSTAPARKMTET